MLDTFETYLGNSRFGVSMIESTSSDLFLHIHFIAKAMKEKVKVLFVSSKTTELNFRIIASKLAIRWDPSVITILDIGNILNSNLLEENYCDMVSRIEQAAEDCGIILLEDATVFEHLGLSPSYVIKLVDRIASKDKLKRLFISFSNDCILYRLLKNQSDFDVIIRPIGGGFGKDATGTMTLHRQNGSLVREKSHMLFLAGERSIKSFYPGHASIFF